MTSSRLPSFSFAWARRNIKRPENRSWDVELGQLTSFMVSQADRPSAPVQHPCRLLLLRGDEADRVLAEPFGRELLLDVGGKCPFVGGRAVGGRLGSRLRIPASSALMPSPRRGWRGDALERAAHGDVDTPMWGAPGQALSSAHSCRSASTQLVIWIGPRPPVTMSARLILRRDAGEAKPPPVPRASAAGPPRQAAVSFCAVGSGTRSPRRAMSR